MTAEHHRRWLAGEAPFDGTTVSPAGGKLLSVPELRRVLGVLVRELERRYTGPLFEADDWHEHDGFISEGRATDWSTVRGWLVSDELLYAARHPDVSVRRAVYPECGAFYLRFYVVDDSENERPGRLVDFDVTTGAELVRDLVALLVAETGIGCSCEQAAVYFRRSYGG